MIINIELSPTGHTAPKINFIEITHQNQNLTGFYDWLRGEDSKIIGVRYWIATWEKKFIADLHINSKYVVISDNCVIVFWGKENSYDNQISQDQEFGQCGIYKNNKDSIFMFFELHVDFSVFNKK